MAITASATFVEPILEKKLPVHVIAFVLEQDVELFPLKALQSSSTMLKNDERTRSEVRLGMLAEWKWRNVDCVGNTERVRTRTNHVKSTRKACALRNRRADTHACKEEMRERAEYAHELVLSWYLRDESLNIHQDAFDYVDEGVDYFSLMDDFSRTEELYYDWICEKGFIPIDFGIEFGSMYGSHFDDWFIDFGDWDNRSPSGRNGDVSQAEEDDYIFACYGEIDARAEEDKEMVIHIPRHFERPVRGQKRVGQRTF